MKIQLKKALKHKGKDLTELNIPLEELTGADLIEIDKQNIDMDDRKAMILPEFSKSYLIAVAARAARIPVEVLRQLGARDFTVVTGAVQNFLTGSGSETSEELSEPTEVIEAGKPATAPAASSGA